MPSWAIRALLVLGNADTESPGSVAKRKAQLLAQLLRRFGYSLIQAESQFEISELLCRQIARYRSLTQADGPNFLSRLLKVFPHCGTHQFFDQIN